MLAARAQIPLAGSLSARIRNLVAALNAALPVMRSIAPRANMISDDASAEKEDLWCGCYVRSCSNLNGFVGLTIFR